MNWTGKQGAVTYNIDGENQFCKMFNILLEIELSWKAYIKSSSQYFRISTTKSTNHSGHDWESVSITTAPGSSVGWAWGYHPGGREFDPGRTNTHGLKNNWAESAAFVITSANG